MFFETGITECYLLAGSKMLCLLEASKVDDALALVTDLSDNLEDRTLEVSLHKEVHCSNADVRPPKVTFVCR